MMMRIDNILQKPTSNRCYDIAKINAEIAVSGKDLTITFVISGQNYNEQF